MTADATLHQHLLDRLDWHYTEEHVAGMEAALRAVVELHAPETHSAGYGGIYTSCSTCQVRDDMAPWPCLTIQAIADQLGLTEGNDHRG